MHIGENPANGYQDSKYEHKAIKENDRSFRFDIFGQNNGRNSKESSHKHYMARREGRLARAIRASVPNKNMVKDKIDDSH